MFLSHNLAVAPRQELADLALPMPVQDGGDGPGQVTARLDPVQFAGFYEGSEDGPILGPGFVTGEEAVLATDGDISQKIDSNL